MKMEQKLTSYSTIVGKQLGLMHFSEKNQLGNSKVLLGVLGRTVCKRQLACVP